MVAAAQAPHHALQRGVDQFVPGDRPVVVVFDQLGRFGGQAGRFVDEGVAQERRHLRRVAADPEPGGEHDQQRGRQAQRTADPHAVLRP